MRNRRVAQQHHEEVISRIILLVFVLGVVLFLGFFGRQLWGYKHNPKHSPEPIGLPEKSDSQRIETECYEFYLPTDFEISKGADCRLNAYARPRKHSYFQFSPYYEVATKDAMLDRWRHRWLTLGAVERSKDRVMVGGREAWRMEEYYPQNNESFVSYLILLDDGIYIDGRVAIGALELRTWATDKADRALTEGVLQDLRWRF